MSNIDVKDLRIGNHLYKNGNLVIVDLGVLTKILNGSTVYEPIELTEEWLMKFGFKIFNNISWSIDNIIIFSSDSTAGKSNKIQQPFYLVSSRILVGITYVHQLQNLHYALTKKELEIR